MSAKHVQPDPLPWQRPAEFTACGITIQPATDVISMGELRRLMAGIPNVRLRVLTNEAVLPDICRRCAISASSVREFSTDPAAAVWSVVDRAKTRPRARAEVDAEFLALADLAAEYQGRFEELRGRWQTMLTLERDR